MLRKIWEQTFTKKNYREIDWDRLVLREKGGKELWAQSEAFWSSGSFSALPDESSSHMREVFGLLGVPIICVLLFFCVFF